jgi:hypothetical protein
MCSNCCPAASGAVRLCVECRAPREADVSPIVFAGSLGACRATLSERGTLKVARRGVAVLQLVAEQANTTQRECELVIGGRVLLCRSHAEARRWLRAVSPTSCPDGEDNDVELMCGRGLVLLPGGTVRVFGRLVRTTWGDDGEWNGATLQLGTRRGVFDGRVCCVGETRLSICGGAALDGAGRLVADIPLAATVVGSVCLPLVVLLALIQMEAG